MPWRWWWYQDRWLGYVYAHEYEDILIGKRKRGIIIKKKYNINQPRIHNAHAQTLFEICYILKPYWACKHVCVNACGPFKRAEKVL